MTKIKVGSTPTLSFSCCLMAVYQNVARSCYVPTKSTRSVEKVQEILSSVDPTTYWLVPSGGYCHTEWSFYQQKPCSTQGGWSNKAIRGKWLIRDRMCCVSDHWYASFAVQQEIQTTRPAWEHQSQIWYLCQWEEARDRLVLVWWRCCPLWSSKELFQVCKTWLIHVLEHNTHFVRLKWIPVVVCVSSMSSVDKHKVAECAASLGTSLTF